MDDNNDHMVVVDGLTKRFVSGTTRVTAVDRVDLTVRRRSVVAVTGASGSGKSTLLHLIGAIERPDDGSVVVEGQRLVGLRRRQLARYRAGIGFVFQRYHLLPTMTVLDNVLAPVVPYRVDFDKAARARDLLASVGLAGRERALPSQLSGGQQQRVAIARALIRSPHLLLADEPTGNLDSANGTEILDLLLSLRDSRNMTVLLATHDRDIAARCDRTIRMRDGRVVEDVTRPRTADAASVADSERTGSNQ